MKEIRILDKAIGAGNPCFVIAEAGVNHNGSFRLAKRMVNAAKDAGADAVKFQVFTAERVVTKTADKALYQKRRTRESNQYEMLKKLELTEDEFTKLAAYAQRRNIIFLASTFDERSVDLLEELKVPAFKIPSGEITNFPLLKHIARKVKPIILSTGMSTLREIAEALEVIRGEGADEVVLLHCVSDYPAKMEEMNLRVMNTLRRLFEFPVGLSDHTLGVTIPIAAVALEASVIEKHFTLDKKLPGPDHKMSLEPNELKEMINCIRNVEKALGNGMKRPTKNEEKIKKAVRKSIVARTKILKGTVITKEMLDFKRPGIGIEPKYLEKVVGKKVKDDIEMGELIILKKLV